MKLTKLSLVAALALTATSAFAIENVKVDGQAVVYYQTNADQGTNQDLLNKANSAANFGVSIGATADLGAGFGAGVRGYYLDTLGLEGNIVNNVIQVGDVTDPVGGAGWLGEAYLTYSLGNTMIKAGRQEVDTPFAFSETWSVFPTTFDGTLIVNKDIQDITLVGAFLAEVNSNGNMDNFAAVGAPTNAGGLNAFAAGNGAYLLAATYTGLENTTINGYAYNLRSMANAYWFDATTKFAGTDVFEGITAKIAYANIELDTANSNATDAVTAELSTKVGNFNLSAAFSDVSTGDVGIYNVATAGTKTKLYTATLFGAEDEAGATDTTSWQVKASTDFMGVGVTAQYSQYDHGTAAALPSGVVANQTTKAVELVLKKRIAEIDLMGIYFYSDDMQGGGIAGAGEEDALRFVARYNF